MARSPALVRDRRARRSRVRRVPDPLDRRRCRSIPAGDSALLIAATPVITAVIAVLIGTDTLNPRKALGVVMSFFGVVLVIGGRGRDRTVRVADRVRADDRRGAVLGDIHGVRSQGPAAPFAARAHDVGHARWDARARAGRDRPARDRRAQSRWMRPAVRCRSSSPSRTRVCSRRRSRTSSCSRASACSARPGSPPSRRSCRRWPCVLAFVFLGEPIRIGQVVGGAIIVGGVALTRRASGRPIPARASAR